VKPGYRLAKHASRFRFRVFVMGLPQQHGKNCTRSTMALVQRNDTDRWSEHLLCLLPGIQTGKAENQQGGADTALRAV
jgi:hypothetical protein